MKTTLCLMLIAGITLSSATFAKEHKRNHLKCFLQLEDKSEIVHHFINTGINNKEFITSLAERSVFMADGVTKKKIATVYECVNSKGNFKNKTARKVEKNTPF